MFHKKTEPGLCKIDKRKRSVANICAKLQGLIEHLCQADQKIHGILGLAAFAGDEAGPLPFHMEIWKGQIVYLMDGVGKLSQDAVAQTVLHGAHGVADIFYVDPAFGVAADLGKVFLGDAPGLGEGSQADVGFLKPGAIL